MKTIFIDFGNVIGFFDHQRAVAQLSRYTDLPPMELTLALYGSTLEEDYELGALSTAEYVRLAKLNGRLTCTDEEFLAAFTDIFWRNHEVCELIPELARRYRLIIASNTNEAHYNKYCQQFADVIDLFDAKCPSHLLRARKPHREFFEACQLMANTTPHECLFLDDLAVNIEAAQRFGWQTLEYRTGQNLRQRLLSFGIKLEI